MPINEIGETKPVLLVTFPNTVNEHFFFFFEELCYTTKQLGTNVQFYLYKINDTWYYLILEFILVVHL